MSNRLLCESLVIVFEAIVDEQSCPLRETGQTRSVPLVVAEFCAV